MATVTIKETKKMIADQADRIAGLQGKLDKTASEQIIHDANLIVVVSDARGRQIGIRKLGMSIRRRVLKALSDENSRKQQYLGLVMVAACVTEIDGDPIALPTTELQFDALIDRLDDDGFEAVGRGIQQHFGIGLSEDQLREDAKN